MFSIRDFGTKALLFIQSMAGGLKNTLSTITGKTICPMDLNFKITWKTGQWLSLLIPIKSWQGPLSNSPDIYKKSKPVYPCKSMRVFSYCHRRLLVEQL